MSREIDVLCIGNAIVDVLAQVDHSFIDDNDMIKGSMNLIDADRAENLYGKMQERSEQSGGSAANTAAGIAKLGGSAAYIGSVHDDGLGAAFTKDIRDEGVVFESKPTTEGAPTARCLIFITPDADRTLNTYLGACVGLDESGIDEDLVKSSKVVYLEGYLWDPPKAKDAFRKAIRIAHEAGRKTSLSLSDPFCVDRYRSEFLSLIKNGEIDILFANEDELKSLYETDDFDVAAQQLQKDCPLSAITRGAAGCAVISKAGISQVAGEAVKDVVDTTGAGDVFAAGFLQAYTAGKSLEEAAKLGNASAAKVIQRVGPRLV